MRQDPAAIRDAALYWENCGLLRSEGCLLYTSIDLDPETGEVQVVYYAAAVDCGTVINPALARVQTEGGIVQGIGMALYEDCLLYTSIHDEVVARLGNADMAKLGKEALM